MDQREGLPSVASHARPAPVTRCDGAMFADFLVAGTYFLRKYRGVINDLNVFPVPDGDTGTNMFFTVRNAMIAACAVRSGKLSEVAAAAAQGSLMGARGNSGVIISQMFRGFAHAVRHRDSIETRDLASALHDAVQAARQSLLKPVEGTIISVAAAAANAAFRAAVNEPDFYLVLHACVQAAQDALEKTPEQLPVLKEANVVDAGGQGFVYFIEGVIRMLPGRAPYTTGFPRRPLRRTTFTAKQKVEEHRFCTEFVLAGPALSSGTLRSMLMEHGDSLIVAGGDGMLRVHIHTDYPEKVMELAREHGEVSRTKVDDMEQQHNVLVVDRESKPRGIVCVVPGDGFAKICKELGADVTVLGGATKNPSVKDLLVAVRNVLAPVVYLFANDKNVVLAANEAAQLAEQRVIVVPTASVSAGIAALFTLLNHEPADIVPADTLTAETTLVSSGAIFKAGRDCRLNGISVKRGQLIGSTDPGGGEPERLVGGENALGILRAIIDRAVDKQPSLLTLYYGSVRKLKDAEALAESVRAAYPQLSVEVYYGGQTTSDYVMSLER